MADPGPTRVGDDDANVLINFIHLDRLDLFGALPDYEFVIPEHVKREVTVPERARRLDAAGKYGHLRVETITDPAELQACSEHTKIMGKGESARLAMAEKRGLMIASDEKGPFGRIIRGRLGEARLLNTPGILLLAIQAGLLTIDEADAAKVLLEKHRFKMKFDSFKNIVDDTSS